MNGKTYPYLELAALPAVGAALLDARPAFVFRGDGTGILWANAAGAAFFGDAMGALLHRRFASASPLARQLARLARLLPADNPRLEILRFNLGVRLATLPAACRRLHLADGNAAVLAVGQIPVQKESVATRAERLADTIASKECLVAVLAGDGRVLGASGCFDDLAPASAAVDAMIDTVSSAAGGLLKQSLEVDGKTRPAGIVRFTDGANALFLLIVGPAEDASAEGVAEAEPAVTTAEPDPDESEPAPVVAVAAQTVEATASQPPPEPAIEQDAAAATGPAATLATEEAPPASAAVAAVLDQAEPMPPPPPASEAVATVLDQAEPIPQPPPASEAVATVLDQAEPIPPPPAATAEEAPIQPDQGEPANDRPAGRPEQARSQSAIFLWQTDGAQHFTLVSPVLAATVGPATGTILGRTWRELASRFQLDPDGRVAAHFAGERTWNGETVAWPIGDGRERIAVELSAIPVFDQGRGFAGFRGFGTIRSDRRSAGAAIIPFAASDDETAATEAPAGSSEVPTAAVAAVPVPTIAAEAEPVPATEHEPATNVAPLPAIAETPIAEAVQTAVESAPGPAVPVPPIGEEDIDVAARKSIERGAERATLPDEPPTSEIGMDGPAEPAETQPIAPAAPPSAAVPAVVPEAPPATVAAAPETPETVAPPASNVVRLPGAPVRALPVERLSGTEQDAFGRIAEALGVKMPEGLREDRRRADPASRSAPQGEPEPDTRLLDKLPVGIVVYRERGILFVNRTLLDHLGYDTPDEFAKAGGAEAIFPDRGKAETAFPDADGILTARRRDGADLRVEARLHAVPWGGATALMLSLVKRDAVPEPERNDDLVEHLVAAERRIDELATILDTATDGIVVIDGHGRIENINRSAEALFGVEAGAVLKQPFTELFAEESRKAALDYLDGLAENGVASVLNDGREVIGKVPKGGLIPLFMTMGRLGGGPKFCAVLRDITHWKNVEEELIAARRTAESANAQKSEFLAKISHEIRTPLNAIIGFSEVMMGERFGPIGNERYRDYLRDIHVSGEHLMSLINDLLDLSKIEAGKLELAFEAVAVNETIQECVALMQPQANRERIIIRTSLSAGVPNVVADQRSLRQILLNLLSNAIKFTGAGGQVIVATTLEDSGEVVLRIRDTGIGMTEKDLETAMKPFRQVTTTGTRRAEGTGLGLPLTKALVEANRAAFSIDSAPNQGTLVKITFPTTRVLAG